MKAIEIKSKTDKSGHLRINCDLAQINKKVRVLILFDDQEGEEKEWLYSNSNNPAFDFLNDPEEDVYTIKDGTPFHD